MQTFFRGSLKIVFLGVALASSSSWGARKILVFPRQAKTFRCQIGPKVLPIPVDEGMVRLQVGVVGAKGKLSWRVPYQTRSNGDNWITKAQVGTAEPNAQGSFDVELDAVEALGLASTRALRIELTSLRGQQTHCESDLNTINAEIPSLSPVTARLR